MSFPKGFAIILFALVLAHPVAALDPAPAPDPRVARMLEVINTRLEPAHRERVLKAWTDSASRPEVRARLVASLEELDTRVKPDWTGLGIGGSVMAVGTGIGVGWLVVKSGLAGMMVAGPVGAVAGLAVGGLTAYAIHKHHQRKAVHGGIFSRTGRHLGFKGRGLEGELRGIEEELARPPAPPAGIQPPAQPKRRLWDRLRGRPAAAPAPTAPPAPPAVPAAPATPATPAVQAAPAAPVTPPAARAEGVAPRDDLNTDDLRVGGR